MPRSGRRDDRPDNVGVGLDEPPLGDKAFLIPTALFGVDDLYSQSLPDPLRQRGESLTTMHDHSAQ
jgi:hypothetical protein